MKRIIILAMITIAAAPTNTVPARQKSNTQVVQLTRTIETKMEQAHNAPTPEKQQQLKAELADEIEQATTYFDNIQNFFGYGTIAEKRRAQAEKQKHLLEHKLAQEEIRYKTLTTAKAKEKSLKKQDNLKNKIHAEKIALGQAWSWQQKALIGAVAAATAYIGYQYGGTAISAAKEWWSGKPEEMIQPPIETPSTILEQFSNKFMQLKERAKQIQQNTTEKINTLLSPSVDQQAAQLAQNAENRLPWAKQEERNLEQAKQELIAKARQSKDQRAQQLLQRESAEQQRKAAAEQANIARLDRLEKLYPYTPAENPYQEQRDQRAKAIKIHEYLKTQNLPPQQLKEYKQYLENLSYNEIPSLKTQKFTVPNRTTSYNSEPNSLLPSREVAPDEQALQTEQYENYMKALEESKIEPRIEVKPKSWYNRFFGS